MLVVAFYTENTPYEHEIDHLRASCHKLDLKYHFEGYQNRGAWVQNCGIKPEFILEMLTRFQDDLLYVDADAVIMKYPKLLDIFAGDIAAHIMKGGVLLSGTVFFRNNERVKNLVKEWVKKQQKDYNVWDQKTLHETIVVHGPRFGIEFGELPATYCKIFDKDWGEPVIQHNQKSREYRERVHMSTLDGVPAEIHKQRIFVHGDGSFTIPRKHKEAEAFLDLNFRRIAGELRWVKRAFEPESLDSLKPLFNGKKCYIIGKGPSLDRLTRNAFAEEDAPVIALNEAIHKVETLGLKNPLFALQQDAGLHATCRPKTASILVSTNAQHWYADARNKYIFDSRKMGLSGSQLAVICAIEIAKSLGAKSFDLICFDACVNKEIAYAKCIGYEPTRGGDPKRFLNHRKHIEKHIKGFVVNWVIPTTRPSPTSSYTPLKQQEHPEEHRERVHAEPSGLKQDTQD